MPETAAIRSLIQTAPQRVTRMIEQEATMPAKREPVRAIEAMRDQEPRTLAELNALIDRAGPLVPGATQAVFGEGPERPGSRSSASSRATRRTARAGPSSDPRDSFSQRRWRRSGSTGTRRT